MTNCKLDGAGFNIMTLSDRALFLRTLNSDFLATSSSIRSNSKLIVP